MGIGIYKWGQGYWVRVLTSAFALIIIAVGGAWLGRSLGTVDVPKRAWTMTVTLAGQETPADLAPGRQLALLGESPDANTRGPEIGTAEFESISPPPATGSNRQLVVRKLALISKTQVSQVRAIATASGAPAVATVVGTPRGEAVFQLLYLQTAGVAVLALIGAATVYWYVGVRTRTVDFLIATDGEMKKVNWSTKKDIVGSTKVVILWCVILVAGLFAVDMAFSTFFRLIGVLQTTK